MWILLRISNIVNFKGPNKWKKSTRIANNIVHKECYNFNYLIMNL